MNFPSGIPLANSNREAWLKKLLLASKALKPGTSIDVSAQQDADGLLIEIADSILSKKNMVTFWGNYVQKSDYPMNAIVYQPNSGQTFTDGTNTFTSAVGFYISTQLVPVKFNTSQFTTPWLKTYYDQNGQKSGICYDPIDTPSSEGVRFWRMISGGGTVTSGGDVWL